MFRIVFIFVIIVILNWCCYHDTTICYAWVTTTIPTYYTTTSDVFMDGSLKSRILHHHHQNEFVTTTSTSIMKPCYHNNIKNRRTTTTSRLFGEKMNHNDNNNNRPLKQRRSSTIQIKPQPPIPIIKQQQQEIPIQNNGIKSNNGSNGKMIGDDDDDMTTNAASSTSTTTTYINSAYIDEDLPAGIVGAEFFGGNKQKQEFFDPIAEAEAAEIAGLSGIMNNNDYDGDVDTKTMSTTTTLIPTIIDTTTGSITTSTSTTNNIKLKETMDDNLTDDVQYIDRFYMIDNAFDTIETATLARTLQIQINSILYDDDNDNMNTQQFYEYSPSFQWDTIFTKATNNPFNELEKSLSFYQRIDVAIISGKKLTTDNSNNNNNIYQFQYEIGLTWPTLWEPRILLNCQSIITIDITNNNHIIMKQYDQLIGDTNSLFNTILKQLIPRFWDIYHIGMTPTSTEIQNKISLPKKNIFASYELYTIPSRIYLQPKLYDNSINRNNNNAGFIPNHSYTTVIITMGPTKQRFSTTSPIITRIIPKNNDLLQYTWDIPLSVEYTSNILLRLPKLDNESALTLSTSISNQQQQQKCQYIYQNERMIATIPYYIGTSSPQENDTISSIREKLYKQVIVRDKLIPKLDEFGRPMFFFIQNNYKGCFTEDGFGMAIFEWRPRIAAPYEIGIELDTNEYTR